MFCTCVGHFKRAPLTTLNDLARARYARLDVYRPTSWWGTTNRSVDKHPAVQQRPEHATCSFIKNPFVTTRCALPCVQAIERMHIDRFVVLHHEGGGHTLYRQRRARVWFFDASKPNLSNKNRTEH
jgi:hypothetical protein